MVETKPFFEWTDDLSVGVPKIDVQHRVMIGFINNAYEVMQNQGSDKEMEQVLKNLTDYARVHFAYEEKLLKKHNHPGTKEHQKEHDGYRDTLEDFYDQFKSGEPGVALKVCDFLKRWLNDHIMVGDKKCFPFLLKKGL